MRRFIMIMSLMVFTCQTHAEANEDLATKFIIFPDSPELDVLGYDNCNMDNNGEINVMRLVKRGDIVFDVGAHMGQWSCYLLNIEPDVSLYGFEPVPELFGVLQTVLHKYYPSLHEIALSDAEGEATFVYYPKHPALSTLHQRPDIEKLLDMQPLFLTVRTERLDHFAKERGITHIDLLKIDTEGNEWHVLMGAEGLLKERAINYIQFEYGGCYLDSKTTLKQVYDYLTRYGYSVYRITSHGLIEISKWRPQLETYKYSNYLAVKND